jgi:hypothetical protein
MKKLITPLKVNLLPLDIKQFDEETINLETIKKFLNDNKDNDEVKAYLKELSTPTKDGVEGFLATEEGKKLLQPKLDSFFTKGLTTWKEKNLTGLVEEEYRKKHPEETEEQKQIRQLQERLDASEKKSQRESLLNKALEVADGKGLPKKLVNYFLGEDEDTTLTNITQVETELKEWAKSQTKLGGRNPNNPNPPNPTDYKGKNPWKKDSINLTEQARILREDPELAKQLQAQAK